MSDDLFVLDDPGPVPDQVELLPPVTPQTRIIGQYDADAVSLATGLVFDAPSVTQQSHADDSDINVLVRRFGLTGEMPSPRAIAEYGDFSQVTDFQTAMQALRASQEAFDALPADLRDRFRNDPARLIEFIGEDANYDEAVRLGLVPPSAPEAPPVVDPPVSAV